MTTSAPRAFSLLCLLAVLSLPLAAQKAIPEPRAGLEFKPPKGWIELPADGDRGATLRLFCAPRATPGKKEGAAHTPLLRVMFFKKVGADQKDVVDGLPRQTPCRGLEDFAQRGLATDKVTAAHEAHKAGAFEGQRVTAKVAGDEERTLLGQTIAVDDGECAVCFELYASQADKLKKDMEAVFDSLATCARVPAPTTPPQWISEPKSWATMDAATRGAARKKWADDVVAATTKSPESAFKVSKSKYWTVLSAADAGFTKKAVAAAEAARAWYATKMPELAKEQLPAVLRIFASPDHFKAFQSTGTDTRDYDARRRELFFVNDPDNGGPNGYGMLFRAVFWHMLDDVDPGVLPALPRWFDNGCWEFLRGTKFDGKKIEFAPSEVEKGRIEYQQRSNTMPAIWHIVQESIQPSPENGGDEKAWEYTPESARTIRWILMHDGGKVFERPNFITDYVRGLAAAFAKIGPDPTADVAVTLSKAQQTDFNKLHYVWRDAVL